MSNVERWTLIYSIIGLVIYNGVNYFDPGTLPYGVAVMFGLFGMAKGLSETLESD